jgi:hypothetical protein
MHTTRAYLMYLKRTYLTAIQCCIPVVEGLLPEPYKSEIIDVLFAFAEWHTLAKLKMHPDPTIGLLCVATKELGRLCRRFKRVV